jgi:hypothetical protein
MNIGMLAATIASQTGMRRRPGVAVSTADGESLGVASVRVIVRS